LPGVERGTSYGTPAIKVAGKLLARLRDDGDVVLHVEEGLRDALIAASPDVFHVTPHYAPYDWVLVRLDAADAGQIGGLIERAWERRAPARIRTARAVV